MQFIYNDLRTWRKVKGCWFSPKKRQRLEQVPKKHSLTYISNSMNPKLETAIQIVKIVFGIYFAVMAYLIWQAVR